MLCILPDAGSYKFSCFLDFHSSYLRCGQKRMISFDNVSISIIILREKKEAVISQCLEDKSRTAAMKFFHPLEEIHRKKERKKRC